MDVGSTDLSPLTDPTSLGFANIYMRAATTMMHALQQFPLTNWNGPPMVLIRPRCGEDWLSFKNISHTIQEGHRAGRKALEDIDAFYDQPGGVYPRRRFELSVDQRQVHRLRVVRRSCPQPHGDGRRRQSVSAHTNGGVVAG